MCETLIGFGLLHNCFNVCHSHEWRVDTASGKTLKKRIYERFITNNNLILNIYR